MILGTGIDIVEVGRVEALMGRAGSRFLRRWFSDDEIEYCAARVSPGQHFAARLAAKEACVKALRPGWTGGILLKDITVANDDAGAPRLRLRGRAAVVAGQAGVTELHVSLSHTRVYAVASVVAIGEVTPRVSHA
jgi:holo-[acyl-carrier protein] synthase